MVVRFVLRAFARRSVSCRVMLRDDLHNVYSATAISLATSDA